MRALSAALLLALFPRIAAAQEVVLRSPLVQAPAGGPRPMRDQRFAVAAAAGAAFGAAAQESVLYGGEALFHPVNELGIGVWGAGGVPLRGDGHSGAVRGVVSPEIVIAPMQGRGDFLEQAWCAYDVHFEVGPAWIQTDGQTKDTSPRPMAGVGILTLWNLWGGAQWSIGVDYRASLDGQRMMAMLSLGVWPRSLRSDDE
jgi:hypothetical protein